MSDTPLADVYMRAREIVSGDSVAFRKAEVRAVHRILQARYEANRFEIRQLLKERDCLVKGFMKVMKVLQEKSCPPYEVDLFGELGSPETDIGPLTLFGNDGDDGDDSDDGDDNDNGEDMEVVESDQDSDSGHSAIAEISARSFSFSLLKLSL
jgi:hypothetical protein